MSTEEFEDLDAVWLRREVLRDGYTDSDIRSFVRRGVWHRLRHGAYCSRELWDRCSPQQRHRLLCRAVLKTAHPRSVLSHTSAAIERGAPVWGADLRLVHLTRTDGRSGRREAGVVHHRGVLPEEHVEELHGVPVTVATRTLVEVCTLLGVEAALVTANGLINGGHTTLAEVEELAHDTRFWPASLATRLVLGLVHPKVESALESRVWHLFWCEHLPRPEPQVEVRDEAGRLVGRVDFAWVEQGVFLEADGREKYDRFRREGESLEDFLLREKRREEQICLLTGWVCLRVGWRDLADPQRLGRRIRKVLEGRREPA